MQGGPSRPPLEPPSPRTTATCGGAWLYVPSALGIVALTDSGTHRDAVTWAARGAALLTLKRGSEALAALRQAQTLAPGIPELRAQLAQAEMLVKNEKPRMAATAAATTLVADAAAAAPAAPARRYSNSAEPSRSN